ncbi:HK97 gp10 family phage protein [Ensifer sp. ENS07]|uniref:HK97 gp10 family phage protein n=1 Tax=Ensifer sp. ENS07 TaxID=2769274 RepID=UPI00177B1746|nr:HK97 gp10 family phage protein [Ensifer sp. ENS07]MBD9636086.1 HK97 gp10 family phage protein [Ensifer sp. ENS07]
MALKTKIIGREALSKRLNEIAPNVEKYAAAEKLKIAEEVAERISTRAPTGATLEYMHSFEGARLADHPDKKPVGTNPSKDPSAAGVFASFLWRWLEFGTAPHNTAAGGGTALGQATHTEGGGTQHPGTAAQPHIFPSWREMRAKAKKRIQAAVNKGVREAMLK